jgi:hypothetical protein
MKQILQYSLRRFCHRPFDMRREATPRGTQRVPAKQTQRVLPGYPGIKDISFNPIHDQTWRQLIKRLRQLDGFDHPDPMGRNVGDKDSRNWLRMRVKAKDRSRAHGTPNGVDQYDQTNTSPGLNESPDVASFFTNCYPLKTFVPDTSCDVESGCIISAELVADTDNEGARPELRRFRVD